MAHIVNGMDGIFKGHQISLRNWRRNYQKLSTTMKKELLTSGWIFQLRIRKTPMWTSILINLTSN
jgi:hypothetical protein